MSASLSTEPATDLGGEAAAGAARAPRQTWPGTLAGAILVILVLAFPRGIAGVLDGRRS